MSDSTVIVPSSEPTIPPGMVPGRNGGFLRAPWQKGTAPNPGGKTGEYHETVALARQTSVAAMRKVIEKMDSNDDRVAFIAAQAILDRAWGKPKDYDPKEAQASGLRFDIDALTPEERAVLLAIIRRGAVRQAETDATPETVDAVAEPQAEAPTVVDTPPVAAPKRKRNP